jgi:hypothetical protein
MLSLATLSRRALVAATAVLALAPQAEAKKHTKPPLAIAAVATTGVSALNAGMFRWSYRAAVVYPLGGNSYDFNGTIDVDATLSPDKSRAQFLADVRQRASDQLMPVNVIVPADRISVTLL